MIDKYLSQSTVSFKKKTCINANLCLCPAPGYGYIYHQIEAITGHKRIIKCTMKKRENGSLQRELIQLNVTCINVTVHTLSICPLKTNGFRSHLKSENHFVT